MEKDQTLEEKANGDIGFVFDVKASRKVVVAGFEKIHHHLDSPSLGPLAYSLSVDPTSPCFGKSAF